MILNMNKEQYIKLFLKNDGTPRNLINLANNLGFYVSLTDYHDLEYKENRPMAFTIITKKRAIINIYKYNDVNTRNFMLAYQIAEYLLAKEPYKVSTNSINTFKPNIYELATLLFNRSKLYKDNYTKEDNSPKKVA